MKKHARMLRVFESGERSEVEQRRYCTLSDLFQRPCSSTHTHTHTHTGLTASKFEGARMSIHGEVHKLHGTLGSDGQPVAVQRRVAQ